MDHADVPQPPVSFTLAEVGALLLAVQSATEDPSSRWSPTLRSALESAAAKLLGNAR